jgi:hypothetical protein
VEAPTPAQPRVLASSDTPKPTKKKSKPAKWALR